MHVSLYLSDIIASDFFYKLSKKYADENDNKLLVVYRPHVNGHMDTYSSNIKEKKSTTGKRTRGKL